MAAPLHHTLFVVLGGSTYLNIFCLKTHCTAGTQTDPLDRPHCMLGTGKIALNQRLR